MGSNAVVPNDDRSGSPLDTGLEVLAMGNMIVQKFEQEIGFLFLVTYDTTSELWIDEQRLLPGYRVSPDERMD